MKNIIKGVLMFIVMALISGCGSRAGESSDNLHKREPMTKVRIYAREVLVEQLDDPMFPCAYYYSSGKPFYGKDKEYYKLSDREIRMVKAIIGDNLYKYFYIIYENNGILGAYAPAPGKSIISLAGENNRERYDNVTILLDLSQKRILEVHDI